MNDRDGCKAPACMSASYGHSRQTDGQAVHQVFSLKTVPENFTLTQPKNELLLSVQISLKVHQHC